MKRITCFTESLGGGGAEHQMIILAGMLAERGYDVTVVTYADVPDHYSLPESINRIKIARGKSTLVKAMAIFFYFMRTKTDCVISYRKMSNIRALVPLLFRSKELKVICSERNTTIGAVDFSRWFMMNVLYHRADYIVSNSNTQTQFLSKEKYNLISRLRTIHNYTDLFHYKISDIPRDSTLIKVAVFARFSKQKNPIRFAEAIAELRTMTDRPFEVHWYGSQIGNNNGFNNDFLAMKAKVEELHVEDVLVLHPSVKDIVVLMDSFHAGCLPSLTEGFSNSIAESICCGKPMLVSDVGDNGVMVREGENGFLFNPWQKEEICSAFMKLFSLSYNSLLQMSTRSREIAEELFDKNHFITQYIELIES